MKPIPPISPLASLRGAGKRYGAVVALQDATLEVRAGEVLAVLGSNGAGKSTALGLLTGRIGADKGAVELFGLDPRDPRARRGIGVMLQAATLPETLRVAEHIRLQSGYYADPRPLAETLAMSGLTDLARRGYGELSGGQQRAVQFALAICGRPPLLFIDEPTTGLDIEARRNVWNVLRALRDAGTSIVLTTHHLEEADALADRIVLLSGGRVLAEDTPSALKARAAGKRVRARTRLPSAVIAAWPEATTVRVEGGVTDVGSHAPEALLRRWLAQDDALAELEVRPLTLEETFLSLITTDRAAFAGEAA